MLTTFVIAAVGNLQSMLFFLFDKFLFVILKRQSISFHNMLSFLRRKLSILLELVLIIDPRKCLHGIDKIDHSDTIHGIDVTM